MSKLERLLNLTLLLLETERPLTIDELHEKIPGYPADPNSFRRSFERDKDDLREMGVPVQIEQLPGGDANLVGYRIRPDQYYLPDLELLPDELTAIQLALAAVDVDGPLGSDAPRANDEAADALRKLGGVEQPLTTTNVITSVPLTPNVTALFEAVVEHAQVSFSYGGSERTVDPWRLDFQRGHWYLTGFDHLRTEERHYRVDRIESDVELDAARTAERPNHVPGIRLTPWQLGEGEPFTAELAVDSSHLGAARSLIGVDAIWRPSNAGEPDGEVATIEVTNMPALRALVLDLLDHATLLAPPEARADLLVHLRTMAQP